MVLSKYILKINANEEYYYYNLMSGEYIKATHINTNKNFCA